MGVALYISLEKDLAGIDASSVDGKMLAKHQRKLDGICKRAKLKPIESFISVNPDELDDGFFSRLTKGRCKEEWFDPKEALISINYLLRQLQDHPNAFDESATEDLESCKNVLEAAEKASVRFRFSIDI